MRGWESISASAIPEHDMYHRRNRIVGVAWSHALYHRFEEGRGSLVADEYNGHDDQQTGNCFLDMEIAQHHIQEACVEWYPDKSVRIHGHEVIPIMVVETIEIQEYICVYLIQIINDSVHV